MYNDIYDSTGEPRYYGDKADKYVPTLEDRYSIYVEQMKQLGQEPKTFDEWLNS